MEQRHYRLVEQRVVVMTLILPSGSVSHDSNRDIMGYSNEDFAVLDRLENFYTQSIALNQQLQAEADIDGRYVAGDQQLFTELYGPSPFNRHSIPSFNRIRKIIDVISGYQRRNRKSIIAIPVEDSSQLTADQFTKILLWAETGQGMPYTISDAFHGSLVTGMNLLHVWMDYRDDPVSGNLRLDTCALNSIIMDPYFRKRDLSDCNGIAKRSLITKEECISLLPSHRAEIEGLTGNNGKDGRFSFMPEQYSFDQSNLLTYDEFHYRDYTEEIVLIDRETGEKKQWTGTDKNYLEAFLYRYPQIIKEKQIIPTVKLAIIVQGRVMYNGDNGIGNMYPFVPVIAYHYPEISFFPGRIQGVTRGLRDSQALYNYRKRAEINLLDSVVNSGWKYKEEALVNPDDVYDLRGDGRGVAVKRNSQLSDVEQILPPQIPPSFFQLSETLAAEIEQISGVNSEMLGSAVDDKAGILGILRQGAGLTTLQGLFDNLDYSMELLGRVLISAIQRNFTTGKIMNIIKEQPTPEFHNKMFGTYSVIVEEGINTQSQKQMQFAQLINLREVGIKIPDSVLINAMTVQNKDELIQAIEQEQQQAMQMQQAQAQMANAEAQSRIQLAQARTVADEGLGAERYSRIQENQALAEERKAEASKDEQQALLNFIKSLKELNSMDIENFGKLVGIAKTLQETAVDPQAQDMAQIPQQAQTLSEQTNV